MMLMILLTILFPLTEHSPLPAIERRAPVVNDAITSNETLAASRNAFLIGRLFAEFDADEEKRKEMSNNKVDSSAAEATDANNVQSEEEGLYNDLVGHKNADEEGLHHDDRAVPVVPIQPQNPSKSGADSRTPTTASTTTTSTTASTAASTPTSTGIKNVGNEGVEGKEGRGHPPMAQPIKPVNAPSKPAQRHLAEHEGEQPMDGGFPLSQTTEESWKEEQVDNNISFTSSQKPEEDATNPFIYPPTEKPESDDVHPRWVHGLFFTVISTGIGFFLLMLLVGLIGRFEGGGQQAETGSRRSARPGDARVVPIIAEEGVARSSAY